MWRVFESRLQDIMYLWHGPRPTLGGLQQAGLILRNLVNCVSPFTDCNHWASWRLRILAVNPAATSELSELIWQVRKWAQEHGHHAASERARAWWNWVAEALPGGARLGHRCTKEVPKWATCGLSQFSGPSGAPLGVLGEAEARALKTGISIGELD
eukprot:2325652-Pyramimonas_sp.AAC.1